jgi:hypothetical protein
MSDFSVVFTRYTLPNNELWLKAKALLDAGYHFEVETLSNGMTSWTVGDDDGDWCHVLTQPHESDALSVERLITRAHIRLENDDLNPEKS